jgi:hypothetical protein
MLFANPAFTKDEHGYIKVPVTEHMLMVAKQKAGTLGVLKNSIRNGSGNVVGYLGQLAVLKAIVGVKHEDTYDYDLVSDGYRYEVKTKDRTVRPLPHYCCSVAKFNCTQHTDYYIFASTYRARGSYDYETVYVLGYIYFSEYFHNATFLKKGDVDPSNNFTVHADCFNLPISKLHLFE